MNDHLAAAMKEQALRVARASDGLVNQYLQNPDDHLPCDFRLRAALELLIVARAYARMQRANGLEGAREYEWTQETIDEAIEVCNREYAMRS
jgi:hypothetical protein